MSLSARKRSREVEAVIESEELFECTSPLKSQKKRVKKNDNILDASAFGELISKSGFILKKGDQPNILSCDQAVFQKNFKKSFLMHPQHGGEILDLFVEGFENHIKDPVKLKWSLLYTQTSPDCTNCRGGQQDSLVRLLLNNDQLQPKLIVLLTEKLLEVAYDEENSNADLPRLILANLRWLDHIVDSTTLTEKIIDLLKGSPLEIQKEIIGFVPNIVVDNHHPQIAEVLTELYESVPELTPSILDSLSYLTLESDNLGDIHHSVLKTLTTVHSSHLPVVVKFLLHNAPSGLAYQVVSDIREKIVLPGDRKVSPKRSQMSSSRRKADVSGDESKLISDLEVLLFSNIKTALLIQKNLTSSWLKAIVDVKSANTVRAFDLLVLTLIYHVAPHRRKGIESILRNMIRMGLPIEPLLPNLFKNHQAVLQEYFDSVKKIADQLLRSSELEISQYGAEMYCGCFLNLDNYQQQEVILSLLSHLGDNEMVKMASLSLLSKLAHEQTASMSKYILYLKGSLDVMDTLSLREAKKLMDAIIHLAHSSSDEYSLREELSILIRKQLSHTDMKFKRLGVLSAVLTLKNSFGLNDASIEDESSLGDEDTLSGEAMKEAEALFDTVRECTVHSPSASALFMDELATNILKNGLNTKLEKWISDKMIGDFEDTFVIDCSSEDAAETLVPVSYQWNLDDTTESEQEKSIAVALAHFVFQDFEAVDKGPAASGSVIVTLAPHFRLMRMVESHLNAGELSNIDALLGCGVQMPNPSVYEKFSSLSNKEQTVALSCLFYVVNWFRELVNAFVTQKDPDLRKRVILRLRKVISLQELLSKLLPQKPSYVPPPAVFDFDVSSPVLNINAPSGSGVKRGRKPTKKGVKRKAKSDELVNSMTASSQQFGTQTQTQTQTQKATSVNLQGEEVADLKNFRPFFRELHLDVFNLLFRGLCLDSELDQENVKYLFLNEAKFLVSDLNDKFARVFENRSKRMTVLGKSGAVKDAGFSHFDVFSAKEVAEQALRYVKPICTHLEKISDFFQGLMSDNDGIEDAPSMFTDRTIPVTDLFTDLLNVLNKYLSWSSLQMPNHATIFTNILRLLSKKLEGAAVTQMSTEELLATSFRYISNFGDSITSIYTAVSLVQLLDRLVSFSKNAELKNKLVLIIDKFLKKEWYTYGGNVEKGSRFCRCIQSLLTLFFSHSSEPVKGIHSMGTQGIKEIKGSAAKDASSELYPTMRKSTLHVFYTVLMGNLVSGTNKCLVSASNKASKLDVWNLSIKTLHVLVEPLRSFSSTLLFAPCLKHSHFFLELFLRKGMPLMDQCLQSNHKEVTALLKNLQLTTRFLQHLCTHVKVNRDMRLVKFVPLVKRSMETFVFRVKAMLALNECQNAFWMGNLKNRDLQGEELLSQASESQGDSENETEADEEEVLEDGLSDVDLDDNSNDVETDGEKRATSVSEVY